MAAQRIAELVAKGLRQELEAPGSFQPPIH